MPQTTRRQALATIAAAGAALAAPNYEPKAFKPKDFELLTALSETIIPETDTPGAAKAGVPQMLDEDAQRSRSLKAQLDNALKLFRKDKFVEQDEAGRIALMTRYMNDEGKRGEAFRTIKELTIDRYYATEAGLVEELGYSGGTYLASFPGCQHPEHGA
ncbi:MAG: gluconate 2-dehydrogenase subunit 3 family protein [Bryobacterales bacterium]